jgi:hypothetical protein
MMKAGTETGSLINHVMSQSQASVEPYVGMGATVLMWTDRKAGTVIKVTKTQVHVQMDIATRTDSNGMSECQSYTYKPDPHGRVGVFRKTKKGWRSGAWGLAIGIRRHYHDYSF